MTDEERSAYLKTLKADTRAMVEFTFSRALQTPALNISGRNEEEQGIRTQALRWRDAFTRCELAEIDGVHMLIKTHTDDLARMLTSFIDTIALENTGEE